MKKEAIFTAIIFLIVSLSASAQQKFTFGVVPQYDARQLRAIWHPIISQIERSTQLRIELIQTPSIPEFEKQFSNGKFDFIYLNPYHLVIANQKQGYYPILKDSGNRLKGIIVVKKDSSIQSLEDLNHSTIVFPAPNALGASLLTRSDLQNRFNIAFFPKYVGNHDSVYLNVLLGLAKAGGGVYGTLNQQKPEIRKGLRVLHETLTTPKHPIAVHPRVSDQIVQKVKTSFLDLSKSQRGKSLLSQVPIKQIGSASLTEYMILRDLKLHTLVTEN